VPLIIWLSDIVLGDITGHVQWPSATYLARGRTFTPGHADPVDVDLEAEAPLLLKYAGCQPRPHPRRGDLPGGVHDVGDLIWLHQRCGHRRQLYGLAGSIARALGMAVGQAVLVGQLGIG
jgi:hypothetical protein